MTLVLWAAVLYLGVAFNAGIPGPDRNLHTLTFTSHAALTIPLIVPLFVDGMPWLKHG